MGNPQPFESIWHQPVSTRMDSNERGGRAPSYFGNLVLIGCQNIMAVLALSQRLSVSMSTG
ncbi:MAG: hypothetical protein AAGA75_02670 [Cyanobacteria bacterium P01_E01_bin.6]